MFVMIAVYAAIACFIAWIWIDYFRLIDVYGNENLQYILYTFFLGAGSILIVVELHDHDLLKWIPIEPNESMVNNFLYCVFKIGLVEEIAKMIPLVIMYLCFRSQFKEPLDYVAFAAISALGFAAAENTLYFISNNGAVISARAILTSVGHMFYSSLIGYRIVLTKYRDIKPKILIIPGFIVIVILSHAFYDFWLLYGNGNGLISILFFLVTVSWYATILNNALNNASTFSYKKTIEPGVVIKRIAIYYGIVFVIQFLVNGFVKDFSHATSSFLSSFQSLVIILSSVVVRLSRFTLIQGRWQPIKIELPFGYSQGSGISIKGGSIYGTTLNKYYEEYFTINPLSKNVSIDTPRVARTLKRDCSLRVMKYIMWLRFLRMIKGNCSTDTY